MLVLSIVILSVFSYMEATTYSEQNATQTFNFYKDKYHKVYKNSTLEKRALKNFIRNLNKVDKLNEHSSGKDTFYVVNKFADIDQGDFEEHYAINVLPYDQSQLHREFGAPPNELRNRVEKPPEAKSVEHVDLYDLDDADNLYKKYMKKFKKKNSTSKYERTVHYFRFLKTLVEMNRDHYKGSAKKLDATADIVKKPFDYTY